MRNENWATFGYFLQLVGGLASKNMATLTFIGLQGLFNFVNSSDFWDNLLNLEHLNFGYPRQ